MKPILGFSGAILILLLMLVLLLCVTYWVDRCARPESATTQNIESLSYDGVVYYFDGNKEFGQKLASFIKSHPELRVVSVAPLDNSYHGCTRGYWVVVEKRQPELMK